MIVRIGMRADVHHQRPASRRYEPAMTIRPTAMPEGVVLDPAGLDLAQAAAGLERRAADGVDGAVDDLAIEPPDRGRDPAADDDEQQVVEVVEPPLVERRPVEERHPGRQLADPLGPRLAIGCPAELDAEQPPGDGRSR